MKTIGKRRTTGKIGYKCYPYLKWNSYIEYIAKHTGKMVGSSCRSKKDMTPTVMFLFKRILSDQKCGIAVIKRQELPDLYFPVLTEFKKSLKGYWEWLIIFNLTIPFL